MRVHIYGLVLDIWYSLLCTLLVFFAPLESQRGHFLGLIEKTLDQGVVFHLHRVILRCITSYNIYIFSLFR